ncbi:uncharacterized protein C8Q71DRAFT_863351 [Rhodofomes roseus]|uniref:Uncharacterized protein n=1 Tax=Rhodofomes roseus TaxID=34475 RepID=A0ABQ8JYB9_9APHY|nr:uncharacterized protein C8Q71DRAFT_863351 [Rhodofomes roseus]KAH9829288.1 hypothetical protein C8Q71DRAFT_863351 [Rhodofomes roseus]
MSLLLTPNGTLLREQWPEGLGQTVTDTATVDNPRPWQTVPVSFDDLSKWADVEIDTTQPRSMDMGSPRTHYTLLWSPTLFAEAGHGIRRRALIRLHGVLGGFCVSPLGNWSGSPDDAKKAVQFVTLLGHDHPAVFDPQVQTLSAIDDLVFRSLRAPQTPVERKCGVINLRWRVFSRVTPKSPATPLPQLLAEADKLSLRSVEGQWNVKHTLSLAMQTRDGQVRRVKDIVFAKGDFVEVAVYVDIVSFWDRKTRQRKIDIQFAPQEIVAKLAAAQLPPVPANTGDQPIISLGTSYHILEQENNEGDVNMHYNPPNVPADGVPAIIPQQGQQRRHSFSFAYV